MVLRARAAGSGRIVSWQRFRRSQLVDASQWQFFTTVLTDVVTDLIAECYALDPHCQVSVVPNGLFRTRFDILLRGHGFEVACVRRLARGLFPLNPFALEFAQNYDVDVTVTAEDPAVERQLAGVVTSRYEHSLLPSEQARQPDAPERAHNGRE